MTDVFANLPIIDEPTTELDPFADLPLVDDLPEPTPIQPKAPQQEPAQIDQPKQEPIEQEQKEPLLTRIFGGIKEAITGKERTTEEIKGIRDFSQLPELGKLDLLSTLGTLTAGNEETANILKQKFPNLELRTDEQGNMIFKSAEDGNEYAIKPGVDLRDAGKALGTMIMFGPAGKITSVGLRILGSALTQLGIETVQSKTGGQFNVTEIGLAGAGELVGPALGKAGNILMPPVAKIRPVAEAAEAAARETGELFEEVPPGSIFPGEQIAGAAGDVEPKQLGMEEIGKRVKAAASSPIRGIQRRAIKELAEQVPPDPGVVQAAKELGIEEYLQPDHITTNHGFREISQAIKSIQGSKARQLEYQGLEKVAARADELIKEFGGTDDFSLIDLKVKDDMDNTVETLAADAQNYFDQLREEIRPKTPVLARNTLRYLEKKADELGGVQNLAPSEQMIYRKLKPKPSDFPSYALLDDVRKNIVAARYSKEGPFRNAEKANLIQLETNLRADQGQIAKNFKVEDLFNLAQTTVAIRKGIENDMASLFGKKLDNSLVAPLTSAFKKLPEGDVSKFAKIIKAIPKEMRQEVVASGLAVAMGKSARNNTMSFGDFANWHSNLKRNTQAYNALMANLPAEARSRLTALAKVSTAISKTAKGYVGTGRLEAARNILQGADSLTSAIYNTGIKTAKKGVVSEIVTTLGGVPGAGTLGAISNTILAGRSSVIEIADDLISKPAFIAAMKAPPEQKAAAVKVLVKSKEFQKFMRSVQGTDDYLTKNPERWVLRSLTPKPKPDLEGGPQNDD